MKEFIDNFVSLYSPNDEMCEVEKVNDTEIILHEYYIPSLIYVTKNKKGVSSGWKKKNEKNTRQNYKIHIIFYEVGYGIYEVDCSAFTKFGQFCEIVFRIDNIEKEIDYNWISRENIIEGSKGLSWHIKLAIATVKKNLSYALYGEADEWL